MIVSLAVVAAARIVRPGDLGPVFEKKKGRTTEAVRPRQEGT
jgi:hypothetical protein